MCSEKQTSQGLPSPAGVVAGHELEISPTRHPHAMTSTSGLVMAGTPSEKRIMFDLTTALRSFTSFVVASSDVSPKQLSARFELFLDEVNGKMSEGHSPATAIDLFLSYSSWAPSEPLMRAQTLRQGDLETGPTDRGKDRRGTDRQTETTAGSSADARELKKMQGQLKDTIKRLKDQTEKNKRLESRINSGSEGPRRESPPKEGKGSFQWRGGRKG